MAGESDTRWSYQTVRAPVTHRMAADDHPDHKFYYIRRVDTLVPHASRSQYQARCSCKWKATTKTGDNEWSTNLRQAKGNHEEHLTQALKQTELFPPSMDTSLRSPGYYQ